MTSGTFRDLLGHPECVVVPAVDDALAARIAEQVSVTRRAPRPPARPMRTAPSV